MEPIVPFTQNALGDEADAMRLLLFAQALFKRPLTFDSVENYNAFMDANMKMMDAIDSPDDAVQVEVEGERVVFSLSDEFHNALQEYKDEFGPVET